MVRFLLPLIAAALCTSALGASVPYSVRDFTRRDFRGTFTRRFNVLACPRKVFHDRADNDATVIFNRNITVDGARCDDNGQLDLFPISNNDRVQSALAPYRSNNVSLNLVETLIVNARRVPGSVVGVSTSDRICGTFTLRKDTIIVFIKSESEFSIATGFPIPAGNRVMVYIEIGENFYCPFSAKPVSTPSPSPGAVINETVADGTPAPSTPTPDGASGVVDNNETAANNGTETRGRGRICFPGSASVELDDGSVKKMAQVQIGDRVRVEGGKFSDVFMFTHKLSDVMCDFVRFTTASGHSLSLTKGHYLRVNGAMQPAESVRVGDELTLASGMTSAVTRVAIVQDNGLYNPQTVEGSIVVDGVVASTYTTAVDMRAAHSMLSPLRLVYNFFGLSMTALESGADSIAEMLPHGSAVY